VTGCLSYFQEEHTPFCRQVFGSHDLSPPRPAPMIGGKATLPESPPRRSRVAATYDRYPFFRPRPGEAEELLS